MKQILVPLDGSALAEHVLPYVRLLAPALQARVLLLHALEGSKHAPAHDPPVAIIHKQHVEAYLAAQAQRLCSAAIAVDTLIRCGFAPQLIAEIADAAPALIAMTTHGYTGVRRMMLGSVADRVLHATQTQVVLVRATA